MKTKLLMVISSNYVVQPTHPSSFTSAASAPCAFGSDVKQRAFSGLTFVPFLTYADHVSQSAISRQFPVRSTAAIAKNPLTSIDRMLACTWKKKKKKRTSKMWVAAGRSIPPLSTGASFTDFSCNLCRCQRHLEDATQWSSVSIPAPSSAAFQLADSAPLGLWRLVIFMQNPPRSNGLCPNSRGQTWGVWSLSTNAEVLQSGILLHMQRDIFSPGNYDATQAFTYFSSEEGRKFDSQRLLGPFCE